MRQSIAKRTPGNDLICVDLWLEAFEPQINMDEHRSRPGKSLLKVP